MDPRLYKAARLGSLDVLNSLLEEDPLILEKVALSSFADTPLHVAILAAKIDFAKEMLLRMPNFARELNREGFSPLHIAAATGNMEITRELLSREPGLCLFKDKLGRTPLHCAAIRGRVNIIGELLAHCYEAVKEVTAREETALHLAVKNNQFEVLKFLVEKLEENDRDRLINAMDDQGNTILELADAKGEIQAQKLMGNQSRQDKIDLDQLSTLQDQEPLPHHMKIIPNSTENLSPSHQKPNRSKTEDDAILVVASLIATVTYQAGLAPPPTIWREGMKLDFKCMFRNWLKVSFTETTNSCPASLFYVFMSFNTAGFFLSIVLILSPYRKFAKMKALLPASLACMMMTYMALTLAMSPNLITFTITYGVTFLLPLVLFVLAANLKRLAELCNRVSRAAEDVQRKIQSKLNIKRQSLYLENNSKIQSQDANII